MNWKLVQTTLLLFVVSAFSLNARAQQKVQVPKVKSVIEKEEVDKGEKCQKIESETYYDQAGNVIEEKEYKEGKLSSHVKNEYDSDNNKIKVTEYDASGKVLKYTVYKYEKNLRTEKSVYGPNQKLKSKKTYQYKFY